MRTGIVLALFSLGCSPAAAAAWMPTVVVRARVTQAQGARPVAAATDTTWSVAVDARWQLARPPARDRVETTPTARAPAATAAGCRSERLCIWERRARTRALGSMGRSR